MSRTLLLYSAFIIEVFILLIIFYVNSSKSQEALHEFKLEDLSKYQLKKRSSKLSSDNSTKSTFRAASGQQDTTIYATDIPSKKPGKHLFKIGLIVPRTAFLSQYKSYKQRIKDTFTHMLQLSHHQHQKSASNPYVSPNKEGNVPSSSGSSLNHQQLDKKPPTSSCDSSSNPLLQQYWTLPWPELTFNQYFDINVANLVNLSQRSNAHEIIESMCHKLITQNVSVIIYLDNNQDQTVASLESHSEILLPHKSQQNDYDAQSQATFKSDLRELRKNTTSNSALKSSNGTSDQSGLLLRSNNQQANSQAHFIMHLAHSAGVPTIAWSVTATLAQRPKKQRTLHLAPTVAHEAEAMLAIMQRYSWYSFSVVSSTLAGHDDFILALRQFMAAYNSKPSSTSSGTSSSPASNLKASTSAPTNSSITSTHPLDGPSTLNVNANGGTSNVKGLGQESDFVSNAQLGKTFKLLDVITIKKQTLSHIEKEMRKLTVSESRVILLYATRGEAIDILRVAKVLKLTKRSYAWIVAQSVIGPNENERAPIEFHPGLLGIYFRSNHERLLDELSRAITIIAHGLERFVRDKNGLDSDRGNQSSHYKYHDGLGTKEGKGRDFGVGEEKLEIIKEKNEYGVSVSDKLGLEMSSSSGPKSGSSGEHVIKSETSHYNVTSYKDHINKIHHHHYYSTSESNSKTQLHREIRDFNSPMDLTTEYHKRLLSAYSTCSGPSDGLSERRGDLLYEYFSKSSPSNVFDAYGSLKDVELSVVNLDNERQWHRIGCFSRASLTIDDITWPEKAERPPSGTMEKFHLRAVFLEEPSFVNLADPDTETGECKTNRAVRCRYKVMSASFRRDNNTTMQANKTIKENRQDRFSETNRSLLAHEDDQVIQIFPSKDTAENGNEFEYKCCSGFCIDLMEKFATDLKFSYELYRHLELSLKTDPHFIPNMYDRVSDGLWGILENNSWNGLVGEIVRGKADVIVSSIKINSDRQKAVDFTVPFLDTGISILVAKQTGVIAKLAFLEPFDTLAWIMFICVGIPIAAISIFYFEWLSPNGFYAKNNQQYHLGYSRVQQTHSGRDHQKFSFCRTLWLVITILFGSAAHIDSPKGYTARFMSNVWATFAVVFLAVYTANLAAFMITREEYLEFSGISDSRLAYPFYRHPPLKFATITGGNTHAVLSANKPNLYNYMRSFNRQSVEDGVDAVKTGQLDAFVYDALVLDYMASQDPECKLVNVGSWYSMTGYALAFPKESRYYEKFNMKMLEYRKNGELDRLRRFWLQGLCKPGLNRHSISKPLDLSQFMSAFLLLGAGILFSVFVLALEHLYILYVRDRLLRCKSRMKLIKLLYPFSLSLAQTLSLPGDGEVDMICTETKKVTEEAHHPVAQSTYLEMNRLNAIHETSHSAYQLKKFMNSPNYQENNQNTQSSTNERIEQIFDPPTNQSQFATVIKKPLSNPELLLLQSLEHYEIIVRSIHEKDMVLLNQTKNSCPDYEIDRSEFRQVKWLVGELRNRLKDLLVEKDRAINLRLEPTSRRPSDVPKIYVTRYPENENIIVGTGDYLVTKFDSHSRQQSSRYLENENPHMRKRVARCSRSSELNCDNDRGLSTYGYDSNIIGTSCSKNSGKPRRLSR